MDEKRKNRQESERKARMKHDAEEVAVMDGETAWSKVTPRPEELKIETRK